MNRIGLGLLAASFLSVFLATADANAEGRRYDRWAARHARGMSWHSQYNHTATGLPVALIVPPTAHMQTGWGWGVAQNTMTPIYPQFRRSYPGGGADLNSGGNQLLPTPNIPSNTDQFGVNYIRGPY